MPAKPAAKPVVREFVTGANRDRVEGKLDFLGFVSSKAERRFAAYMNKNRRLADGSLRLSDNWKRGIPLSVYAESLVRHAQEFRELVNDAVDATGIESAANIHNAPVDHPALLAIDEAACGLYFNVQGWLHERVKALDANNVPYPGKRVHGKPPLSYQEAERLFLELVAATEKKVLCKAAA
jgi:hypothetical protein